MHETFTSTPVDRESLPQGKLNIAARVRTNPFPWTGQFSPQLVEELLTAYAPRSGVILDPFVGSGTSLVEAARQGLPACGGEINPAAVILTRVYQMVNLVAPERIAVVNNLRERLCDVIRPSYGPLFFEEVSETADRSSLEAALIELWRECPPGPIRNLAAALIVLCDFHRNHLDAGIVHKNWLHIERIVRSLPESHQPVTVHHADARALPVESGSVDLVLTSPPYINVHNYHQISPFGRSSGMGCSGHCPIRDRLEPAEPREPLPYRHPIFLGYDASLKGNGTSHEVQRPIDSCSWA